MLRKSEIYSGIATIDNQEYQVEMWEEDNGGLSMVKRYFRTLSDNAEIDVSGKIDTEIPNQLPYRRVLDLYKFKFERVTDNIFAIYYSFDNVNKVVIQ